MLTKAQKLEYIMKGGEYCPKCGDMSLETSGLLEVEGDHCFQDIICTNTECDFEGSDSYVLEDVEEND